MKNTEARKVLGLDSEDDPRAFLPAFEETIAYKKELIENAPSDEIKFRYQQELLEYEAAVKVVASRTKLRPHTDFIITLFLIASFAAVAWWGYGWYQEKWNTASENDIEIARQLTVGRIAVDKRKWSQAEEAFQKIKELDPNSTVAAQGFEAIKSGKAEERSQQMFYNLGESQAALEAGRWDDAEKLARLVLAVDPENSAAKRKLTLIADGRRRQIVSVRVAAVTTALDKNDLPAARSDLQSLKKVDANNPSVAAFNKRINDLDAGIKLRQAKALDLFEKARKLDNGEFSAEAMTLLSEALRLYPENTGIKALHSKMGSYTRAILVPSDYPTLAKAIAAARPRDLIRIAAGTYKESIVLEKQLRLEGSPDGKTIIELPGANSSLLEVEGAATGSSISNLTLRHTGFDHSKNRNSAVTIASAQANLSGITIEGAVGHGIAVIDGAQATITGCTIKGSGWDGISVYGEKSTATVSDTLTTKNIQNGVSYWNGGGGTVTNTRALKNGLCGILAMSKNAQVTLKSNTSSGNRDAGILISDGIIANVELNRCEKNLLSGIVVRDRGTRATLIGNTANNNHEAGILTQAGTRIVKFEKNTATGNTSQQIWRNANLKE